VRPRIGVGSVSASVLCSRACISAEAEPPRSVRVILWDWRIHPHFPMVRTVANFSCMPRAPVSPCVGAPGYFRQFQVGRVIDENLLPDGSTRVSVFVEAPYRGFLKPVTRFWSCKRHDVGSAPMAEACKPESWRRCWPRPRLRRWPTEAVRRERAGEEIHVVQKAKPKRWRAGWDPRYIRMRFAQALGPRCGRAHRIRRRNIGSVVAVDLGYDFQVRHFPSS